MVFPPTQISKRSVKEEVRTKKNVWKTMKIIRQRIKAWCMKSTRKCIDRLRVSRKWSSKIRNLLGCLCEFLPHTYQAYSPIWGKILNEFSTRYAAELESESNSVFFYVNLPLYRETERRVYFECKGLLVIFHLTYWNICSIRYSCVYMSEPTF